MCHKKVPLTELDEKNIRTTYINQDFRAFLRAKEKSAGKFDLKNIMQII